jgi:hypothetical protein
MTNDLHAAWEKLHAANDGLGWFVGPPGEAFDPKDKVEIGRRSREWTPVGQIEEECIREMGRCSRKISNVECQAA